MSAFASDVEQSEELEVLLSIYPDECELISDITPRSFKIHLVGSSEPDQNHVAIAVIFEMPIEYPTSIAPNIDIEIEKGISKKQIEEIKSIANRIANENIGMPSIFTICEGIKEWLQDNNIPGQDGSMYADMMRRMQQKDVEIKKKAEKAANSAAANAELSHKVIDPEEEERLRKREAGTPVTEETFMIWKKKFDEEMAQLALQSGQDNSKEKSEKLTGKQLFLQDKAGVEETIEEGDQGVDALSLQLQQTGLEDDDDDDDEDYIPSDDDEEDDDEDYEDDGEDG